MCLSSPQIPRTLSSEYHTMEDLNTTNSIIQPMRERVNTFAQIRGDLHRRFHEHCQYHTICHLNMGWLRLVGSLKLQVSFAEYHPFYRALLQKRPIILRSLLIVATPYHTIYHLNIMDSSIQPTGERVNKYAQSHVVIRRTYRKHYHSHITSYIYALLVTNSVIQPMRDRVSTCVYKLCSPWERESTNMHKSVATTII